MAEKASLTALVRQQLELARQASSGRSAQTVFGGHEHVLRQTVIALAAGHGLASTTAQVRLPCTSCKGGCGSGRAISVGKARPGTS